MKLLLDANVVIWMLHDHRRLRPAVKTIIDDTDNSAFVSAATLLEITSKAASGRLVFSEEMKNALEDACVILPVTAEHAFRVQTLPPIHKDPFDRVIIAQALLEKLTLVTGDQLLGEYGVQILLI